MKLLRSTLGLGLLASLGFGAYPVLLRGAFDAGVAPSGALLLAAWGRLALLLFLARGTWRELWQGSAADRRLLLLGGVCETCLTAGVFFSLLSLPAAIVSTGIAASALPVALWEVACGRRRPTLALTVAIVGGVLGVVATTGVMDLGSLASVGTPLGWVAMVIAIAGMIGSSAVAVRRLATHTPPHVGAECFLVVAALLTLGVGPRVTLGAVAGVGGWWLLAAIGVLGLATVVAYHGMARSALLEWRVLTKLQPAAALGLGWMLGVDALAPTQILGVVAVLAAVLLFQWDSARAPIRPASRCARA